MKCLLERDAHHRFVVPPGDPSFPATRSSASTSTSASASEAGQQIGKIDVVKRVLPGLIERTSGRKVLAPVGRRPKFLARGVAAELIESGALFGVFQRLVGLCHL